MPNIYICEFVNLQIVAIGSDNCSNGDKLQSGGREGGWGDDLKYKIWNMKYKIESINLNSKYKKYRKESRNSSIMPAAKYHCLDFSFQCYIGCFTLATGLIT